MLGKEMTQLTEDKFLSVLGLSIHKQDVYKRQAVHSAICSLISCYFFIYPLYVRQGTAITERESDDVCFRMYCAARDLLKDRRCV